LKGIVTGFSSGIGKEICAILEKNGFSVIKLKSRLEDTKKLESEIKNILKENEIYFLINAAGIGVFEPMQTISVEKIKKLIDINLVAPLILTKLLLPALKKTKGHIINISSIEALRASKFSALYSASKAGLRHFSHSLFEEVRKDEIKVTSINPDLTNTNFFKNNNLKFKPLEDAKYAIEPKEIANLVLTILQTNSAITDITIRPQKSGILKI
jgi:short-subunit dehydrogenase